MPRIPINYELTPVIFYRFVCNDPEIKSCYVGHTINFTERKAHHKKVCNGKNYKHHNLKIYETIRDAGGFNNWRMVEIESKLVSNKRDAERIEQFFIDSLHADMNMYKSFAAETKNQYQKQYELNRKGTRVDYNRNYRETHPKRINEKTICECGRIVKRLELTPHRKSQIHKDLMEQQLKEN